MAMAFLALVYLLLPLLVLVEGSMPLQCTADCRPGRQFEQYCCVPNNQFLGKSHRIYDNGIMKLVLCPSTRPQLCERLQFNNCSDVLKLLPTAESGYYNITLDNGNLMEVYCDMEGTNCGGEGGWMRIADIDMTTPGTNCPEGLYMYDLTGIPHPVCSYLHVSGGHCDSTIFPTHNIKYSSVCGRVRGYQHGGLDGIYDNNVGSNSIESFYVDGVSITYGSPRQHVWTFIGGQGEDDAFWEDCPCNTGSSETVLSFVGDDYYCESGFGAMSVPYSDPLWDGQQCNNLEAPCCTSSNLPYFKKDFDESISDDIEFRICGSEGYPDEATPVDIIELYVR